MLPISNDHPVIGCAPERIGLLEQVVAGYELKVIGFGAVPDAVTRSISPLQVSPHLNRTRSPGWSANVLTLAMVLKGLPEEVPPFESSPPLLET